MVLVEVDPHSPHVLAIAHQLFDIVLHIDRVIGDLRLTVPMVIIFDKRNFCSSVVVIKIL